MRFYNNLRGYVRATITPERMDVDFRCLSHVLGPGAEPFTRRSFAVDGGTPGLRQTADHPPAGVAMADWATEIQKVVDRETRRP